MLDKRHQTCASCEDAKDCKVKYQILEQNPKCPLGKIKSYQDMITERAWPSEAPRVSGCCDSAMNYGD